MRPGRDTTFTAGRRQLLRRRHAVFATAMAAAVAVGAAAIHTGLVTVPDMDEVTLAGAVVTVERHTGIRLAVTPVAGPRMVASGQRAPVAADEPSRPAATPTSEARPARPLPVDPAPQPAQPAQPAQADADDVPDAREPQDTVGRPDVDVDEDSGAVRVAALQQRLRDEGFLIGPVDGRMGQQTVAAVMAFQQAAGLPVDGVVGPRTRDALASGVEEPALRGGPATRIEVDLDAQVLHVIEDDVKVVTLKVSSGDGGTYRSISGGTARSRTPVGEFTIQRRIRGVRVSRLGTLYDPLYFYGGFAIHGSPSVPPGPASHGCIRVTRADGRWLFDRAPNGTPVIIHGGTHVFSPQG